MKTTTKTLYTCDFCETEFRSEIMSRAEMQEHEKRCSFNPENKACNSCDNFLSYFTRILEYYCKAKKKDIILSDRNNTAGCEYYKVSNT